MTGSGARRLPLSILVVVLALLGVVPAAQAKAKAKPKPKAAKVSIAVIQRSRTTLLSAGLRVKVTADRKVTVKLSEATGLAKGATLKFTRKGTRSVTLKLTTAARTALAACGQRSLAFRVNGAFGVPKGRKTVTKTVSGAMTTTWTGPTCPVPPPDCDPIGIGSAHCLLPFPNDYYTKADASSQTGRRLNLHADQMPVDKNGRHIDPTEWNANDGFSPGQAIVVKIPGLDNQQAFTQTGLVPITDIARYADAGQPAVVIDATNPADPNPPRQMIWAELDTQPGVTDAQRTLIIRPGKNWQEGHRYIVALRGLKNAVGQPIQPSAQFKAFRDNTVPASAPAAIKARKAALESDFATLGKAGIARSSLNLAWDFTVASEKSLSGRFLAMRDNAFDQLGDTNLGNQTVEGNAPAFTVDPEPAAFDPDKDTTWTYPTCSGACQEGQSDRIAKRITGTFKVPCYLTTANCAPGGVLNSPGGGLYRTPVQKPGNFLTARYTCRVPRASLNGPAAIGSRAVIYGHGLLGGQGEVGQGQITDMAFDHKTVYCATDWYGMATADVATVLGILTNLSNMPKLPDRVQEGMLAFQFLGRLLAAPAGHQGFADNAAWKSGADPLIEAHDRIYYDGNSQGGIIGGAVIATAPDLDRGTLGVLGMNYSTLLQRSTDFSGYAVPLYATYPDKEDRQLLLGLMQMLWDRGEANGYAEHMTTDPYPDTPVHHVLLHSAFGDHQVSNWTALVEARTIGAKLYTPDGIADHALDPGRWAVGGQTVLQPFLGIDPIPSFPYDGSALVFFDSGPIRPDGSGGIDGVNPEPLSNNAPVNPDKDDPLAHPNDGEDPHEFPRRTATGQQMKSDFYAPGGLVEKTCGTGPCYSDTWTGP